MDLTNLRVPFEDIDGYVFLAAAVILLLGAIAYLRKAHRTGFVLLSLACLVSCASIWLPAIQPYAPCGPLTVINCGPNDSGTFYPYLAWLFTMLSLGACLVVGCTAHWFAHRNDRLNAAMARARAERENTISTGANMIFDPLASGGPEDSRVVDDSDGSTI